MADFDHTTVLLHEAVAGLNIKPEGTYIDMTLGGAGHTSLILDQLNEQGRLIAFDQDQWAIDNAQEVLRESLASGQLTLVKSNFRHLKQVLNDLEIKTVDGILYDLGVSSPQLDEATRGFSYHQEAKLDMRMNREQDLSAYEVVDIIKEAIPAPARRSGGHPAKRIFQAIRIAVNDELNALEDSLKQAVTALDVGGRLSVISFHSLEDKIVKHLLREYSTTPDLPRGLPIIPDHKQPILTLINTRPITPGTEELEMNNRARSSLLRIAEKQRMED